MKSKICGIYCIQNLLVNRVYIGQSVNIHLRWEQHKSDLKNHRHSSTTLQADWDLLGEKFFKFGIVKECPREVLDLEEQILLLQLPRDLLYNMTIDVKYVPRPKTKRKYIKKKPS